GKLGVPIFHLSADYVFDGAKPGAYVETDPLAPLNVYGATKAVGEAAVAAATPDHVVLRISWIYSPFGKNFVRTILQLAKRQNALAIVADQCGSPTSAFDVADGIIAVVKNLVARPSDASLRGVFHMAAAGEVS